MVVGETMSAATEVVKRTLMSKRKLGRHGRGAQAKGSGDFSAVRLHLFSDPNLRLGIAAIKRHLDVASVKHLFQRYAGVPLIKNQLIKNPFPKDLKEVEGRVLSISDFERELLWLTLSLNVYASELGEFVNYENRFYRAFLAGSHSDALIVLDETEERFGLSRWSIFQRLAVFHATKEDARRSDYIDDIVKKSENSVVAFVSWLNNQKLNPEVSRDRFWAMFDRYTVSFKSNSTMKLFVARILEPTSKASIDDLANFMGYDERSALIDRYLGLLEVLGHCVVEKFDIPNNVVGELELFSTKIDDERLQSVIGILLGRVDEGGDFSSDLIVYDLYTRGEYQKSFNAAAEILESAPNRAHLYEICARAGARVGSSELGAGGSTWRTVVRDIAAVFLRQAGHDEALVRLQRIAHSSTVRSVRLAACSFLARENALDDGQAPALYDGLSGSLVRAGSPWHIRALDEMRGSRLVQAHADRNPASACLALQLALVSNSVDGVLRLETLGVPYARVDLYRAHVLRALGRHQEALSAYREHLQASFLPDQLSAARGAVLCHRAERDYIAALDVLVPICLEVVSAYRAFDLAGLLADVRSRGLPAAYSTIRLPIAYELYSRYVSLDRDAEKSDAAEEFVFSKGVDLPSQMDLHENSNSQKEYVYFLGEVCTPRVLDPFLHLENTSDVELERISICQKLAELDADRIEIYSDEIRAITRRRIVRERLKQVEKSKIFVDTPNIKRVAERSLREQYSQFIDMINRPDYDTKLMGMINQIREVIGESQGVELQFPGRQSDERDNAFIKLCNEIFSFLISSPEHGLKTYLSTRIKHGTLAAQLSSPFSVNNLLLEQSDGEYGESPYWHRQMYLDASTAQNVNGAIAKFSRRVDDLITNLKNEWIQVKSDAHKEAWLDFPVFRSELLFLQAQIGSETPFEDLFELVLEKFWKTLDVALRNVRSHLEVEIKATLNEYLNDLQESLEAVLTGVQNSGLIWSAIAAARTEMQNAINVVIGWFKLNQGSKGPDYDFSIAVEVAVESINSCFRSRPIHVDSYIDVGRDLKGQTLESVVDILFILFENAITHSRQGAGVEIELRAEGAENVLLLEVKNEVAAVSDVEAENAELRSRMAHLGKDSGQALVSREGGSGFPKILKIIKHDLNAVGTVEAKFIDVDSFRTDIVIQSGRLFT